MVSGTTQDKLKKIKQSFRLLMNGVASQSMREKGVMYKINWGISVPELRQIAKEYGEEYDLAIELWKEDIRECMILATLIMPKSEMKRDIAELWMERVKTQEMAEALSFNLLHHLDFAKTLAFQWIATEKEMYVLCGYNILSRLFTCGQILEMREINEYLDQVYVVLQSSNIAIKHTAYNSLLRFCDISKELEGIAKNAIKDLAIL